MKFTQVEKIGIVEWSGCAKTASPRQVRLRKNGFAETSSGFAERQLRRDKGMVRCDLRGFAESAGNSLTRIARISTDYVKMNRRGGETRRKMKLTQVEKIGIVE